MNYSKQRELVREALASQTSHPTAEELYHRLKTDYPRLSLATVYRNLNQLCEERFAQKLHLPGAPDRFDAITVPHYHLYCRNCGGLYDLSEETDGWRSLLKEEVSHRVEGCQILFFGICDGCLRKAQADDTIIGNDTGRNV